ncbi:hypothetical protein CDD83_9103 [Cordyceps sp. RAO-2017]|nr:hypothetical protein CDD83_9103 [Cordyceps sp. RAO-2017]
MSAGDSSSSSSAEAAGRPPLSQVLPPLILGTATFNTQYHRDPARMPCRAIVRRALEHDIAAFDTSPYYGPSETLLGDALRALRPAPARDGYFLITKAGRIAADEFDYSPAWIRYSVCRSLDRLGTPYLDLVYMHDVEFVADPDVVVAAVAELRRLRDRGLPTWRSPSSAAPASRSTPSCPTATTACRTPAWAAPTCSTASAPPASTACSTPACSAWAC